MDGDAQILAAATTRDSAPVAAALKVVSPLENLLIPGAGGRVGLTNPRSLLKIPELWR